MITFEMPFPSTVTVLQLPNPKLNDETSLSLNVSQKRSMNGTRYTYVKRTDQINRKFAFELYETDGLAAYDLIRQYSAHAMKLTDIDGTMYIGHIKTNPITLENLSNDWSELQFEFEGVKYVPTDNTKSWIIYEDH